jgi:hypothetical protein
MYAERILLHVSDDSHISAMYRVAGVATTVAPEAHNTQLDCVANTEIFVTKLYTFASANTAQLICTAHAVTSSSITSTVQALICARIR